jgi:hypothetical protein
MSTDPCCCHALHSQLLMFTIQQGAQALTALFVHEPLTLTSVEIPKSRLNVVPLSIRQRLVLNEVMQTLAATEALLSTASALAKQSPDHPWLSSGHLTEVFDVRAKLQELSVRSSSNDPSDSESDSGLAMSREKEHTRSRRHSGHPDSANRKDPAFGSHDLDAEDPDGQIVCQTLEDDMGRALNLKTRVLLLAQALLEEVLGISEGVSGSAAVTISLSSQLSSSLPASSANEPEGEGRKASAASEAMQVAADGVLWGGPEDEEGDDQPRAQNPEQQEAVEAQRAIWGAPMVMVETAPAADAQRCSAVQHPSRELNSAIEHDTSSGIFATSNFPYCDDPLEENMKGTGDEGVEESPEVRVKGPGKNNTKDDRSLNREDALTHDLKKKSLALAGIGGMTGGVGGVVGGLLHGSGTLREGGHVQRPSTFDATILSSVPGRCCYVIPGDYLMDGHALVVHEDEPASLIALALSSKGYKQALYQQAIPQSNRDTPPAPSDEAGGSWRDGRKGEASIADTPASASKRSGTKSKDHDDDKYERERQESHVNVTFEAEGACGPVELSCKVYFAHSFHQLRLRYCRSVDTSNSEADDKGEQDFIRSLCRCKKWNPTGGRSGSAWLKTADERFVLKAISKKEIAYVPVFPWACSVSPRVPPCLLSVS